MSVLFYSLSCFKWRLTDISVTWMLGQEFLAFLKTILNGDSCLLTLTMTTPTDPTSPNTIHNTEIDWRLFGRTDPTDPLKNILSIWLVELWPETPLRRHKWAKWSRCNTSILHPNCSSWMKKILSWTREMSRITQAVKTLRWSSQVLMEVLAIWTSTSTEWTSQVMTKNH